MTIGDFGCLLTDNTRSKAYIQKLTGNSLVPEKCIYVETTPRIPKPVVSSEDPCENAVDGAFAGRKYFLYSKSSAAIIPADGFKPREYASFDAEKPVIETLDENSIDYEVIKAETLNAAAVVDAVGASGLKYCLFSGGAILGKAILSQGVRFIHIHPGYLPDIKGSMAIEWSILLQGRCAATAFFMEEKIDRGDIICRKYFDMPELENNSVPPLYSSHIRSEVLVEMMKEYVEKGRFSSVPQDSDDGGFYFKMHPSIHNIVFHEMRKLKETEGNK